MYDFLTENNLLSSNQSGFTSDDSCTKELLSINHKSLNAFDKELEVFEIFLRYFPVNTPETFLNNNL